MTLLPLDRCLAILHIVYKEGGHLIYSHQRVFATPIDAAWVINLDNHPEQAEKLESFVSRFGRMQDTIADKLLPRWLGALAEPVGSQIETLNRAERLGVLTESVQWLEARKLRNCLIHEYLSDPVDFADKLTLSSHYTVMLIATYNRLRMDLMQRLKVSDELLPPALPELTI